MYLEVSHKELISWIIYETRGKVRDILKNCRLTNVQWEQWETKLFNFVSYLSGKIEILYYVGERTVSEMTVTETGQLVLTIIDPTETHCQCILISTATFRKISTK